MYVLNGALPTFGTIDQLYYNYMTVNTGKRLSTLPDYSGNAGGRPAVSGTMVYTAAGELIADPGRGVSITYDSFSLPRTIVTPQGRIELGYDALGRKWSQKTYTTAGALTADEATYGGVEYRAGKPYAILHAHGRARFDNTSTRNVWTYEFALKDHLGSTRVVLRDRYFDERDGLYEVGNSTTPIYKAIVTQVDDYYPFGLRIDDQAQPRGQDFQYTYTGQENVPDVGLICR